PSSGRSRRGSWVLCSMPRRLIAARAWSMWRRVPATSPRRPPERGAAAIGVDIAEGMLSLARRLYPQLDFRSGNAVSLPFADDSFDAVVANFALLHLGRPERAAAVFARVLSVDGRVALTVWYFSDRARLHGVVIDAAGQVR